MTLQFDLSTALFSSAFVDPGTIALLRALERPVHNLRPAAVLDVGSGTGTLGISLAATSGAALLATDRDALAVWFTSHNAALNKISSVDARTALGICSPFSRHRWRTPDLAVCNLPAKAGEPVIRHIIGLLPDLVSSRGFAGVVILAPLSDLLMSELERIGAKIIARHQTGRHVAVVYSRTSEDRIGFAGGLPPCPDSTPEHMLPAIYSRGQNRFIGSHGEYRLTVANNLAEFDSLSYATELAFRLLRDTEPTGKIFVWGPGQGHLAVGGVRPSQKSEIYLADRDLLAITTTIANLESSHRRVTIHPLVTPGLGAAAELSEAGAYDWMIVQSDSFPGSLWTEELLFAAERTLAQGGRLLVASRSTDISRLRPVIGRSFSLVNSVRNRGFRADLMIRKP